jgi:G3E family GTPase
MSDFKKISTVLVCGFLGAGKTTFLENLLKNEEFKNKKTALLINDFGALPVDAEFLSDSEHFIAKINKGNIFCACVKGDLINAMEEIADKIQPEVLVIEATGLAEPSDFSALLLTDKLKNSFIRDSVYCIVDALNFYKIANIMTAPAAQVELADVVIINKIDLVGKDEINRAREMILKMNPSVEILEAEYSKVEVKLLNKPEKCTKCAVLALEAPEDYERYDFIQKGELDKVEFYSLLEDFRNSLLRAKGVLSFLGKRLYIDVVNGIVSAKPVFSPTKLDDFELGVTFILREHAYKEFLQRIKKFESK